MSENKNVTEELEGTIAVVSRYGAIKLKEDEETWLNPGTDTIRDMLKQNATAMRGATVKLTLDAQRKIVGYDVKEQGNQESATQHHSERDMRILVEKSFEQATQALMYEAYRYENAEKYADEVAKLAEKIIEKKQVALEKLGVK